MSTDSEQNKVTLKLLVDKEKRRVVLAESDRDFVDILFSFLTLPLGTIIRILDKPSELRCLSNLYTSVENLSTQHLQTAACKTMLLWPRSEAAFQCEDLKINIDDTNTKEMFKCFCSSNIEYFTTVPNTNCTSCVKPNSTETWNKQEQSGSVDQDRVFVKGGVSFMITDALYVSETSTTNSYGLLRMLDVKDRSVFEEMTLDFGREEILCLLKRSLISATPLSDICFSSGGVADSTNNLVMKETSYHVTERKKEPIYPITESEKMNGTGLKRISTKVLVDEANNRVVYAEAGEELMNLLFSFLTFPLGSVIRFSEKNSSMSCIDNLYRSAENLNIQYFQNQECKSQLLSPKLAPFFGCGDQLLKVEEVPSYGGSVCDLFKCFWRNGFSYSLHELNPKMPNRVTESGGGFVKEFGMFVVMDGLGVIPLTPISTIQATSKLKVPTDKLVEMDASIEKTQALNLLRAALSSESALNDVFCPTGKKKPQRWMRATLEQ